MTDEMVEIAAKAIANVRGHGMREKCESDARAALEAVAPMLAPARVPDAMEVDGSPFQTWDHDTYKEYGYALGWNASRDAEVETLKAECDALRQRIESARMTTVRAGINDEATIYQEELPPSWIGKRVRLVVDDM